MVTDREVRVGNLLKYESTIYRLKAVSECPESTPHDVDGHTKWYLLKDLKGITITSTILQKLGFVDNALQLKDTSNLESLNQKSSLHYDYQEREAGIFIEPRKLGQEGAQYWITCEYLHQLQNLYFALTGDELEINHLRSSDML